MSRMYEVNDIVANELVKFASLRVKVLRQTASANGNRGPKHADFRRQLRSRASEYERAIAGINTGEGVTRRSARERT